jgi:GntR family transcriptional regulator
MAGLRQSPSVVIMSSIDRDSAVPPYRQVANALRGRIADGTIPPGRRIPSLVELEAEFSVARDTLRKAVQVLKDEGLVETVPGMGVYVIEEPPTENA